VGRGLDRHGLVGRIDAEVITRELGDLRQTLGQLAPAEVATCAATGRAMSLRETVAMVTGPWTADPEVAPERSGPHLTRRESEVARLVAAGLSNRQIADRLFISPRTAEYHVEQIRNKLGFHSRAQVAAWSAEKTGSPTP
jgi:non-specific serine/threonine protein kinase